MPACNRNKLLLVEPEEFYARWNGCTREDPILRTAKMCNASVWAEDHEDIPASSREHEYDEAAEELEEVESRTGKQFDLLLFSHIKENFRPNWPPTVFVSLDSLPDFGVVAGQDGGGHIFS
jgi:hypothetical protein